MNDHDKVQKAGAYNPTTILDTSTGKLRKYFVRIIFRLGVEKPNQSNHNQPMGIYSKTKQTDKSAGKRG